MHKVYALSELEFKQLTNADAGICLICGKTFDRIGIYSIGSKCDRCRLNVVFGAAQAVEVGWIKIEG